MGDKKDDAALGAIFGALIGDSIGSYLEFLGHKPKKDEVEKALEMKGGGYWKLSAGQITDDGELTISLASALAESTDFDTDKIAKQYIKWLASKPFDCGETTIAAFSCFEDPALQPVIQDKGLGAAMTLRASRACTKSQSNGSLMRATPLAVWGHNLSVEDLGMIAQQESSLSHPHPICCHCYASYVIAIAHLLNKTNDRKGAFEVAHNWAKVHAASDVVDWLEEAKEGRECSSMPKDKHGWVKIGFSHAFRHLYHGTKYELAIKETIAAGGDTDTNACIVGGMVGAACGFKNIPGQFVQKLMDCETKGNRKRPQFLHPMQMLDLKEKLLQSAPAKLFKAKNLDPADLPSEKPEDKKDDKDDTNNEAKNGNKKDLEAEKPPTEQYFGLIPLGEGSPIPLKFMNNLPIILGRGGLTGIEDNRLSRQHLEIHKTAEKNRVNIKLLGSNASKIIRKETGEEFKLMKGKVIPLQVDDTIQFLPGLHGYMLVETGKMDVSEIEEPKTPEHSEPEIELQNNNAAKNKRQPTVLQEEDEKSKKEQEDKKTVELPELNSAAQNKKRKLEEAESEQKAKKMKLDNEEANHISTIKGILPDVTERQIKIALTKAANNIEQALEYLLTASHQSEDASKEKMNDSNNNNNVNSDQVKEDDGDKKKFDQSIDKQPEASVNKSTVNDIIDVKEDVVMNNNTNGAAKSQSNKEEDIVKLYEELERYKREKQRAEEDTKAQQEIIKILMKEKEEAERLAGSNKKYLDAEEENKLYLPGEKDALKGTKTKIFALYPSTRFENDAATIHFRMAESQFYRLMDGESSTSKVTKVEYVINPKLMAKFQKRRLEMAQEVDWEQTKPILCFHGTREENIPNIIENNFNLDHVGSTTDAGFFGAGIYFSELPSISMSYAGGAKFLLCQVLVGQTYKMPKVQMGCGLKPGYHSHSSPCGSEIVIFNMDQILPTYIVHFGGRAAGNKSGAPKMTLIYDQKNADNYDGGYDETDCYDEDGYDDEYY